MEIAIDIHNDAYNQAYIPLLDNKDRRKILYGGRDSGKSDFIASRGIEKCLEDSYFKGVMIRKHKNTIKESCFEKIKSVIIRNGLADFFTFLTSPVEIRCVNGNRFVGAGMDDPDKAKSLEEPTWGWYEEADQLSYYDFSTTTKGFRTSEPGIEIEEWFSFNSASPKNWIVREFFPPINSFEKPDGKFTFVESTVPGVTIMHTCHLHNEFLHESNRQEYQRLKHTKPDEYAKDGLGLFVKDLSGLIYPDYHIIDRWPDESMKDVYIGGDFGYSAPNAFVRVGWDSRRTNLYIDELFYEGYMTERQLIEKMIAVGVQKNERGYLDSSEGGTIQAINTAGFRLMKKAKKDSGSVMAGVKMVQGFNIHITSRSKNVLSEIDDYRIEKDRYGVETGEPAKGNDHAMDAIRYPVYTSAWNPAPQTRSSRTRRTPLTKPLR